MITINSNCINLIKNFEGLVLHPYHGAADRPEIFTIGYGTIKYPPYYLRGKMVALTDPPISETQAENFLHYEVSQKSTAIDLLLRDDLSPNQFGALVSFAYNLGDIALKQSTIRDEFMRWVHSNGAVVEGLIRRRRAEADLYFQV